MARGKNKEIAERRKQAVAELGTIDSQQNSIKKLSDQVAQLQAELQTKDQVHKQVVAGLHYKLEQNTTELVEELRGLNDSLREELGQVREDNDSIHKKWTKVFENTREHFMSVHGMKNLEAVETVTALMGDNPFAILTVDMLGSGKRNKMSTERLRALQKVQGIR